MAKVSGKAVDVNLLKRVFMYVKPYRAAFIWAMILTVSIAIVAPLRPLLIEYTVDKYVLQNDSSGLLLMTIVMIGLLILQTVIQYYHTFLTNMLGQSVIRDLRIDVFNHISSMRLKYFDRTPIGQIITRTVSDLETIADTEYVTAIGNELLETLTEFVLGDELGNATTHDVVAIAEAAGKDDQLCVVQSGRL